MAPILRSILLAAIAASTLALAAASAQASDYEELMPRQETAVLLDAIIGSEKTTTEADEPGEAAAPAATLDALIEAIENAVGEKHVIRIAE